MQIKELLEMLDLEENRLIKQVKQDRWNIRNRNSVSTQQFYINQISLNKKYIKDLKTTIQTIIMRVSVEDQPN